MANTKHKLGNVAITVWKNEKSVSFTVEKSYKDDKDKWQSTNSLNRDDLLKLKQLIDKVVSTDINTFENK